METHGVFAAEENRNAEALIIFHELRVVKDELSDEVIKVEFVEGTTTESLDTGVWCAISVASGRSESGAVGAYEAGSISMSGLASPVNAYAR